MLGPKGNACAVFSLGLIAGTLLFGYACVYHWNVIHDSPLALRELPLSGLEKPQQGLHSYGSLGQGFQVSPNLGSLLQRRSERGPMNLPGVLYISSARICSADLDGCMRSNSQFVTSAPAG